MDLVIFDEKTKAKEGQQGRPENTHAPATEYIDGVVYAQIETAIRQQQTPTDGGGDEPTALFTEEEDEEERKCSRVGGMSGGKTIMSAPIILAIRLPHQLNLFGQLGSMRRARPLHRALHQIAGLVGTQNHQRHRKQHPKAFFLEFLENKEDSS